MPQLFCSRLLLVSWKSVKIRERGLKPPERNACWFSRFRTFGTGVPVPLRWLAMLTLPLSSSSTPPPLYPPLSLFYRQTTRQRGFRGRRCHSGRCSGTSPRETGCKSSSDCRSGFSCNRRSGRCSRRGGGGGGRTCSSGRDCPSGMRCRSGRCRDRSSSSGGSGRCSGDMIRRGGGCRW